MTTMEHYAADQDWFALSTDEAAERLSVDVLQGLHGVDVKQRQAAYGPNALPQEPPPSTWMIARGQLLNPMNIMLLVVAVTCLVIAEVATGLVVLGLVVFNVVMGSRQELKAQA